MSKPDNYETLCRRLANICNTSLDVVKRDMAQEANLRHVRPIVIARERIRCLSKWSFLKLTNTVCCDGGSLRHLPHEAVAPFARAMKKAAKYGGDVWDYYRESCKKSQIKYGLTPHKG